MSECYQSGKVKGNHADRHASNAQMKLNCAIKDALDPKGILAPGKNGIWPKSYNAADWKVPDA